jgi:RNA polymerase sigma factor (sigma-70 family)
VSLVAGLFRLTRVADFDRLYQHHAASVYRYAYAVLGNHADAEDITQQTFLNAYRAIARGTKPRKAENWLLTIVHNEVRRHLRSNQGRAFEVELDERLPHPAPEETEPSVADILRALQHLPPAQRSALVMREFEGRSYAEIAVILNVTQSALETLLFRARRSLAEHLEGGLTCAEADRALSRRLDGRLPRREARRLKAHLKECPLCTRVAEVQKRQRSLLEGLSVIPIPASLFLFRGEQAAAAGLSASAVAAGGSAGVGGGGAAAGAGGAGIAAGLVAKAAAVSAAAAVAGGVGYGVAARPEAVTTPERAAAPVATVGTQRRPVRRIAVRLATPAPFQQPRPAGPPAPKRQAAKTKAKQGKAKTATADSAPRAKKVARLKTKTSPPKSQRARATSAITVEPRPTKRSALKPKPVPPRPRARPAGGERIGPLRTVRQLRLRPPHVAKKAEPYAGATPPEAAERRPTK